MGARISRICPVVAKCQAAGVVFLWEIRTVFRLGKCVCVCVCVVGGCLSTVIFTTAIFTTAIATADWHNADHNAWVPRERELGDI